MLRPVCLSDEKKIRLPSGENHASMSFHSPVVSWYRSEGFARFSLNSFAYPSTTDELPDAEILAVALDRSRLTMAGMMVGVILVRVFARIDQPEFRLRLIERDDLA